MLDQIIFESHPKLFSLEDILIPLLEKGLIIAYSGGVDSGFLLWFAMMILNRMKLERKQGKLSALLVVSPSIPNWEIEEAKKFAFILKADLIVKDSHELQQESYAKNDKFRCYYCKSELFRIAKEEIKRKNYHHIAYGYNASDRQDIRFGHFAANENNIHAPLELANLYKNEIRNILKQVGLSLSEKPSSPCLSSRIMTGVRITPEKLEHVQTMENILRQAGLRLYRVRVHEEKTTTDTVVTSVKYFRIEVSQEEMPNVLKLRNTLVETARNMGYRWVNLDLSGYQMGGGLTT